MCQVVSNIFSDVRGVLVRSEKLKIAYILQAKPPERVGDSSLLGLLGRRENMRFKRIHWVGVIETR